MEGQSASYYYFLKKALENNSTSRLNQYIRLVARYVLLSIYVVVSFISYLFKMKDIFAVSSDLSNGRCSVTIVLGLATRPAKKYSILETNINFGQSLRPTKHKNN